MENLRVKLHNAKFGFVEASDEQLRRALEDKLNLYLLPEWKGAYFAEKALSADDEKLKWARQDFKRPKPDLNTFEINRL